MRLHYKHLQLLNHKGHQVIFDLLHPTQFHLPNNQVFQVLINYDLHHMELWYHSKAQWELQRLQSLICLEFIFKCYKLNFDKKIKN